MSEQNEHNSFGPSGRGFKAQRVMPSPPEGSISHNRNIAAAAVTHPGVDTTNTATWTEADAVRELELSLVAATPGNQQNDEVCLAVLDAPSAAIAKSWLEAAGGIATDVEYHVLHYGRPNYISADSNIRRLDVLPVNVACRVVAEAR